MFDRGSRRCLTFLAAVCIFASTFSTVARGEAVYFSTHLDQVLRWTAGNEVEVFQVSANLTSLDFDAGGTLWATGASDPDGNGLFELFTVEDYLTDTPRLVSHGEFLDGRINSLAWIAGVLYGTSTNDADVDTVLKIIDEGNQSEQVVGTLPAGALGAMAYDGALDVLHAIAIGGDDEGYDLLDYETPESFYIGNLSGIDWTNTGGAFFDGAYYVLNTPTDGTSTRLYRVNEDSSLELVRDLSEEYGPQRRGGHALAILPEPTAGALMLLGGFFALRRQSR